LEPLAIKLLTPYSDFKRSTYAALTLYNFNQTKPPFNDIRVREALTITIDRDRISQDVMGGSTVPADRYLPDNEQPKNDRKSEKTSAGAANVARARALLVQAGYPEGKGFPKISLLINRNEQQRAVAQTIASMWKTGLNIDTEVVARNWEEYEAALNTGEYDIARRSVVMPAPDERLIISMIFEIGIPPVPDPVSTPVRVPDNAAIIGPPASRNEPLAKVGVLQAEPSAVQNEAAALKEFAAIPLFFASSYALVKPYVSGFETNLQDAPSLKRVKIDPDWEPPARTKTVWWK
jgi:ABC-type transport system substrate-binding protein